MSYYKPTLHMLGLFHTIPNHHYDHCAFTGKVLRFARMMQAQGYNVVEYSNGKSISGAYEQVEMLTEQEVQEFTNTVDNFMKLAVISTPMWQKFNDRLVPEMKKRVKNGDIICHPFGHSHTSLMHIFPNAFHIETGIGYDSESFGAFRIYESYAAMHYHQGKTLYKDDKGVITGAGRRGNFYEWVVPNYYHPEDWEPSYEKGKYLLFFGRVYEGKGMSIVSEMAKHLNEEIIVAGMGDITPFAHANLKYIGPVVGQKERSDLLRNAKAVIMPTLYVEPFGGVNVEAQMCGTPVITVDYGAFTETVEHGKTGFRCHTLGDFLEAANQVNNLDRKYIADRSRHLYSTDTVGRTYDRIFMTVSDLSKNGWYTKKSHFVDKKNEFDPSDVLETLEYDE